MSETNKVTVDARGLACPLPVVNTKNAIAGMSGAGTVLVQVDNEIAVQNLQKFAAQRGYAASSQKKGDADFEVELVVTGTPSPASEPDEQISCQPDQKSKGMVIVMDSDCIGEGADKLGHILMKSFIFAMTKQDVLPETMLFYNSGAFLTSADSEVLEDLKTLEAAGVRIETCGTCMDFYNIKDKLAVGTPTNMYEIVETLEKASKVVRP